MKVIDIIFSLICGKVVGFVVTDITRGLGIELNLLESLVLWLIFPALALIFLWLAGIIGKKLLFVFQAAKHVLVGAFATVLDLKFFELLVWVLTPFFLINPLVVKAISFIVSTCIKFWGNKYWAFAKHGSAERAYPAQRDEKEIIYKEIIQFFGITLVGLTIDVLAFYYMTHILGPQFSISALVWTKLAVIFAALAAAVWNFLGYKFWVFKK